MDLFKTPQIRRLTFKMSYLYFCRFAAYYAVFIIDIEGSRLLVNFLFGLIEFCAPLICLPIINRSFANRSLWCSAGFGAMVIIFALGGGISQGLVLKVFRTLSLANLKNKQVFSSSNFF